MTYPQEENIPDDDFYDRPSKTQKKKDSHVLQSLGEDLLTLPADRIAPLGLPEILLDAVKAAKKITAHEGRRRQMQYIGKLMRKAQVEPLREAVAAAALGGARSTLELHRAERWRVELVEVDEALTRWTAAHPQSDLQQLRSLIRAARKDAALPPEQRHGRAWRELFQFIKPHMASVENADE